MNSIGNKTSLSFFYVIIIFSIIPFISGCGGSKLVKKKVGNVETIIAKDGSEPKYKIIYTYEGGNIVKGEYWVYNPKGRKDDAKKKKSNLLADTAIAKSFENMLSTKGVRDDMDLELGVFQDKFQLMCVQLTSYDRSGKPVLVRKRGFTDIPILGRFLMKTDLSYAYGNDGKLIRVTEKNINVDTLLLKFAIGNITVIDRDGSGRPVTVTKAIGSVPPSAEEAKYYYYTAGSPDMKQTVYTKVGIVKGKIQKTETITMDYKKGVPWSGEKKYNFSGINDGLVIYDEVEKKNKIDGRGFSKMNYMKKMMFLKTIYDYVKLEMQGPVWRMGVLPDVPRPYLVYSDYAWYN